MAAGARLVLLAAVILFAGCAVELTRPEQPPGDLVRLVRRAVPPPRGHGLVALGAAGAPTRVYELSADRAALGDRHLLCGVMPCVVGLPFGPHSLVFVQRDEEAESRATLDIRSQRAVALQLEGDVVSTTAVVLGVPLAVAGTLLHVGMAWLTVDAVVSPGRESPPSPWIPLVMSLVFGTVGFGGWALAYWGNRDIPPRTVQWTVE